MHLKISCDTASAPFTTDNNICYNNVINKNKENTMKLKPIINSLLETDLYKFSMGCCIFHQFNKDMTRWAFKCRNKGVKFTDEMLWEIREQIVHFCDLRFTEEELEWLGNTLPWISSDYILYLKRWQGDPKQISVLPSKDPCGISIEAYGSWLDTSMYEIPILSIVNEVYFAFTYGKGALDQEFKERTIKKLGKLAEGEYELGVFSEFGLRRRYSGKMQDWLVRKLADFRSCGFVGTSNVYLAKKYGLKPVGTMAHEFTQVVGQAHHEHNPAYSNHYMMKAWVKEYQTQNGIALTDTIGTDAFLRDFNLTYATLFSGVRHDSGGPIAWGEKIIAHYKKLGIDPRTKTLLFSDSLDFDRATEIYRHFKNKAKVAFGIGTFLSNDCGVEPLNIVFKVIEANGSPCAKLSDVEGKGMCRDEEYVEYLKRCINWRLAHEKEV